MNNLIKAAVVVAILLVGIGVFYRLAVYDPDRDATIQSQYKQCKADVQASYTQNWADACRAYSAYATPSLGSDPQCSLPSNMYTRLDEQRDAALQRCFNEAQNGL